MKPSLASAVTAERKAKVTRVHLTELPQQLLDDPRVPKLLAKAALMSCSLVLAKNPFEQRPGMTLWYQKGLQVAVRKLPSLLRISYSEISTEIRRFLQHGPDAYFGRALAEIAALLNE